MPSRLLSALHDLDTRAYRRVHGAQHARVDSALRELTGAADHSKLWMAVAAGLALSGDRYARRAAVRGLLSVALTSAAVNGPLKSAIRRPRPDVAGIPLNRLAARGTRTSSFPSGHSASAAAFATAVALECPPLGLPLAGAAAAVGYSRVNVGAHYPGDVVVGLATGASIALATRKLWPVAPHEPAASRQRGVVDPRLARPTGAGVRLLANPSAGSALGRDPLDALRECLPALDIRADGDLVDGAKESGAEVLGVCGGDGSVNAVAEVALERGLPLWVVPGGTLNHFAHELGLDDVAGAVDALEAGAVARVDVARIAGKPFLNTASFGAYPEMVAVRERLEKRIGKWPALAVAMVRVLRRCEPLELEVDGERRRVWMSFIGNCCFHPAGFAPSWRERLDDGLLDVRLVDADQPWARTRLLAAVLTGRLGQSRVYEQRVTQRLEVRSLSGPIALARDGEVFDGPESFVVDKTEQLHVYSPAVSATQPPAVIELDRPLVRLP